MPPPRKLIVVDEFCRVKLPWSPDVRAGDEFRVRRIKKGKLVLTLVHAERLTAPQFERILRTLNIRSRNDIHFRQYIRHWLRTFRPDRGSFTGRVIFRHAVRARRELFSNRWQRLEHSDGPASKKLMTADQPSPITPFQPLIPRIPSPPGYSFSSSDGRLESDWRR